MKIIPLNKKFNLNSNVVNNWHESGPGVTQFLNAMSLFFPAGERYFIRSVRALRHHSDVQEQISGFIGQEGFHGREHQKLNKMLNTPKFDVLLERALDVLSEKLPPTFNLAATCALEHLTAILAQGLLEDIDSFLQSDEEFRNMWTWHALEETNHKAVAYDLYDDVMLKSKVQGYIIRCVALVLATAIFLVWLSERYVTLLHQNKQLNIANIASTVKFLFVHPATFGKAIPRWLDWFRPGFHPWDHDNSHELSKYKELLEE